MAKESAGGLWEEGSTLVIGDDRWADSTGHSAMYHFVYIPLVDSVGCSSHQTGLFSSIDISNRRGHSPRSLHTPKLDVLPHQDTKYIVFEAQLMKLLSMHVHLWVRQCPDPEEGNEHPPESDTGVCHMW